MDLSIVVPLYNEEESVDALHGEVTASAERLGRAGRDFAQRELTREAFERKLLRFYDSVEERIREERPDGQTARLQARHQGHR